MSADSTDRPAWPAPLAARLPGDASVEQVADAAAAVWRDIDAALHPIIGHHGVAALYNRSVKLAGAAHPWLTPNPQGMLAAVDPAALRSALLQRTPAEAAAGAAALFGALHDLLASLVGPELTQRLLRAVWVPTSAVSPAQDHSR